MKRLGEPALKDMLEDPIICSLMARDGVRREELVEIIAAAQGRLGRRAAGERPAMTRKKNC